LYAYSFDKWTKEKKKEEEEENEKGQGQIGQSFDIVSIEQKGLT